MSVRQMGDVNSVNEPDRIAIVDLADDLQVRKQRIFKVLGRLGISQSQRRDPSRRNQLVATVTSAEANRIRAELEKSASVPVGGAPLAGEFMSGVADDVGYFYLIQLEPDHDPGRFKLGFTTDLDGRLRKHRCSAPFSSYVATWPCKRGWERAAIDCATEGCEKLHTEVFRATSIDAIASRAKAFFTVMPHCAGEADERETDEETGNV